MHKYKNQTWLKWRACPRVKLKGKGLVLAMEGNFYFLPNNVYATLPHRAMRAHIPTRP